jgi:hypothetical protein
MQPLPGTGKNNQLHKNTSMKKMKGMMMAAGLILVLAACKKSNSGDTAVALNAVTVTNLYADTILGIAPGAPPTGGFPYGSGKYTLYSLRENKIIPNTDSATTKWDIGFRGTTIITNSGNSGPGAGGAFVQLGLFTDLKTIAADSTFRSDNAPSAYAITSGSGRGWYVYDAPTNLVNPIPGRVLVIRTADGKYAKIEILNYYKGGITPAATASDDIKLKTQRYYTFRFVLQTNGTKNF